MTIDQATIAQFLMEFKDLTSTGRNFYFIDRPEKNSEFINLGLNIYNIKQELLGLSVDDYYSGPDKDRDRPGDVWMFGKEINGHEVYIKIKIFYNGSEKNAKCISFHEAESPIKYPFRK